MSVRLNKFLISPWFSPLFQDCIPVLPVTKISRQSIISNLTISFTPGRNLLSVRLVVPCLTGKINWNDTTSSMTGRFTLSVRSELWQVCISLLWNLFKKLTELMIMWTASSEFDTYRLCEQRRFRRACASAQSRQNLRSSLIQAVSQEEPSDRNCRIGYRHSHSRVSQCLASIRKLGNGRSSEGLRSFKPSKGTNLFILIILAGDIEMNPGFNVAYAKSTVRHRIDFLNVRNAKNAFTLHAQTLVTTNS